MQALARTVGKYEAQLFKVLLTQWLNSGVEMNFPAYPTIEEARKILDWLHSNRGLVMEAAVLRCMVRELDLRQDGYEIKNGNMLPAWFNIPTLERIVGES
jgi:hypothetical protein